MVMEATSLLINMGILSAVAPFVMAEHSSYSRQSDARIFHASRHICIHQ
jgi:hypothetical protein